MPTYTERLCEKIHRLCRDLTDTDNCIRIMEVCGTHTMAIARNGLRSILPDSLKLISGPGCPVCVTDQSYVDRAVMLAMGSARQLGADGAAPIIATYGDMIRVPGREGSLDQARARGADVSVVYSADQALELARRNPDRQVVFLAIGFETTSPGAAMAIIRADDEGVDNFSILTAHKLILPAMRALLSAGDVPLDGFLCPGHVSVILGYEAYGELVGDFGHPCVVAGFDPNQVLEGIAAICGQLATGRAEACSVYPAVSAGGNATAMKLMDDVFTVTDARWRALGVIPSSGLELREELERFDAAKRFELPEVESYEPPGCRCGEVITGRCEPDQCVMFGAQCTPRDPIGPCMVSSEGACAAAYKYGGARSGGQMK